jgi:hypothetical protein
LQGSSRSYWHPRPRSFGSITHADSITESNTTTDGTSATVNAGQGEMFLCSLDAGAFSCTDPDKFTCYGWGNCAPLDVIVGFTLDAAGNPVPLADQPPVSTPEPDGLALLAIGLVALALARSRLSSSVLELVLSSNPL